MRSEVDSLAGSRAPIKHAGFIFGGNATFTVVVPESFTAGRTGVKDHYTFKVKHKDADGKWPEAWFVMLLTGPDNTRDFSYLGKMDPRTGTIKTSGKSCCAANSWPVLIIQRVAAIAIADRLADIEVAGWQLMHEGRCCVCGRKLTVPESIASGIGPECASR